MASLLPLRRRRPPTPAERVLGVTSLALRALPAVKTARTTVKVVRRAPLVVGGGAVAVLVVRRARAGAGAAAGTASAPASPTPAPTPAPAPAPAPAATVPSPVAAPDESATVTPHGDTLAPGLPPEPGPAGTQEVETGGGPSPALTPHGDPLADDDGGATVEFPAGEVASEMTGAPHLAGGDVTDLTDLPPNESGPGHEIPPAPPEDALTATGDRDPDAPNEGATGDHPG